MTPLTTTITANHKKVVSILTLAAAGRSAFHREVVVWGGFQGPPGVSGLDAGGGESSEGGVRRLGAVYPHRIMPSGEAFCLVVPVVGEVGARQRRGRAHGTPNKVLGQGRVRPHALHVRRVVGAEGGVEVAEGTQLRRRRGLLGHRRPAEETRGTRLSLRGRVNVKAANVSLMMLNVF